MLVDIVETAEQNRQWTDRQDEHLDIIHRQDLLQSADMRMVS